MKVVITDYQYEDIIQEKQIISSAGFELFEYQEKKPAALIPLVKDADAIITQYSEINETVIESLMHCKMIIKYGIGVNNIDVEAASKKGIYVCNVPGCLEKAGIEVFIYAGIRAEPDVDTVDSAVSICKENKCDSVIALGGGSVIDTAKMVAMVCTNGGRAVDYQLNGRPVTNPPLLFISIPSTVGTGAEATKVSVLYNKEKGFKKSIYHTSMISEIVILDPEVVYGIPNSIIASTGIDAITHAIESYVSVFSTPVTKMYSLKALQLLKENIVKAYDDNKDLDALEGMLLGSYLAGCAITAGTCLAHIVGQPVGAIYHIPHGNACSIYLTNSMRLNMDYSLQEYYDVAKVLGVEDVKTIRETAEKGIMILEEMIRRVGLKTRLTDYVCKDDVNVQFIIENIQTSMGHIKTNPRPVSCELFEQLLEMSM